MQQPITSMRGLIIHVLRVAFFIEKEERISRGEFLLGVLSLFFVWSLIFFIDRTIPSILAGGSFIVTVFDMVQGLSTIIFIILVINLAFKRLKDLDKLSRGWFTIFIPYASAWMVYDKGSDGVNRFGDDPMKHIPQNNSSYWGLGLVLLMIAVVMIFFVV